MSSRSQALGLRDTRGAVFVEHIIAFLPVIFFGLAVWQLIELAAADLVVKRAASAAARAAIVVLPDDPMFYGGVPVHTYAGQRRTDIELAAALILATNPHFLSMPTVEVQGPAGGGIRATENASLMTKLRAFGAMVTGNAVLAAQGGVALAAEGSGESGPNEATAVRVTARFECFAAWVNLVCGGSHRMLSATAVYPYQGAAYVY